MFMKNAFGSLALAAIVSLALWSGCNRQGHTPAGGSTPSGTSASTIQRSTDPDFPAGLQRLSEANRAAVLAQRVCPVSGAELGVMGEPQKVVVNDREVFICCPNCEDELRADPAKYLDQLDRASQETPQN